MNLFKNTDYSFCNNKECNRKEKCMRHIDHYPKWRDGFLSYILIKDYKKCNMFIRIAP